MKKIITRIIGLAWGSVGGWLLYWGIIEWKTLIASHLSGQAANLDWNISNLIGMSLLYIQYFPNQLWTIIAILVLPFLFFILPGVWIATRRDTTYLSQQ